MAPPHHLYTTSRSAPRAGTASSQHRDRLKVAAVHCPQHATTLFAFSSSGLTAQVPLDKMYETMPVQDGSAAVHIVVHCTLADLACMMNLRVKDAAFALNECGLLVRREGEGDTMTIAIGISQEMVEAVAWERNIKQMCIDFTKVLL